MTEAPAFFAMGLVAVGLAFAWDAATGEVFPSVGGLFVGLICGAMLFG